MSAPAWEPRDCRIRQVRLAWREAGRGPSVLYLHDAGADTLASTMFDDLAGDHHVLVADLPGYGGSDAATGMRSAVEMASVLSQLLDITDTGPAVVVGSSLGGWFAAELAAAVPTAVSGLVLIDSAGLHAPHSYLFELFAQGAAADATHHLVAEALLERVPPLERPLTSAPPAVGAALVGPWVQNLAAAAAMSWHPAVTNPALLGRLHRVVAPTLILWGECDALIPLAHGRAFAEGITNASLQVVAGAGHLLALERPDVVAAAVRSLTLT